MNQSSGKRAPRKAMRVATVFTGVTACAAAFTPAADAQTARTLAPANTVSDPHCNNGHWFHGVLLIDVAHRSMCFGDRGYAHPESTFAAFCGGNNIGFFSGFLSSAFGPRLTDQKFGTGTTYYWFTGAAKYHDRGFDMSTLHISKFSGAASCLTAGA